MKQATLALFLGVFCSLVQAQMSPVGLWRSIDDKTGEPKAHIRITQTATGKLSGTIEKRLLKNAKPEDVCDQCTDDRKNQALLGLEIIRGAQKTEGKEVWEGGTILDPENGRNYRLRLTPVDEGRRLEVRGSFGPFGRTQTWQRLP